MRFTTRGPAADGHAAGRLRPADRRGRGADAGVLRERRPEALWQAGGATALFIGGFGSAGYATRRDLPRWPGSRSARCSR